MSRIHEALKKAEQERLATVPRPENDSRSVTASDREDFVAVTLPPSLPPLASRPDVDLTAEALLTRCPKNAWKLDPKNFLTFGRQQNKRGTEEFRTLRSRLDQLRLQRPIKRVLVTSALPAEGKTFVCMNLGSALVRQRGCRTLLIDADLRHPKLHSAIGAPAQPGLSDYLKGEADVSAILQQGPVENLFAITGGKQVSNAAELIAGTRLKTLLDQLSSCFDWIIVDSPAAVLFSDASRIANHCDGVLLVVRSASTPFDLAQKARQEFRHTPLLGAVLNRASSGGGYESYYAMKYKDQAGRSNGHA